MELWIVRRKFKSINWKYGFKKAAIIFLWLLGISIALSIFLAFVAFIGGVAFGLPVGAFLLLRELYEYVSSWEYKYYYAVGFVTLLILLILLFRRIGLVSLSTQSLAHRRNLFFAFFLVFLIENFDLDVAKMFKADNNQINSAANGILALFALYSFVEYAHNFLFDFLRSKNESKIIDSPSFFRFPRLVDIWLILIGNYRALFDIVLPVFISTFILIVYISDVKEVFKIGDYYITSEVKKYIRDPKNSDVNSLKEKALLEYDVAEKHLEEVKVEAEVIIKNTYDGVKSKINQSLNNNNNNDDSQL